MSLGEKMKGLAVNVQEGVKTSSISIFNIILRLITGIALGLTIALICQELFSYGNFALLFCLTVVAGLFLKISNQWSTWHILIFDLICILVAQLLRMYILLAP